MALFVCGVALRKYNHSNLSPASRAASVEIFELLAVVAEDLVFLYMGASVWDADFREHLDWRFALCAICLLYTSPSPRDRG